MSTARISAFLEGRVPELVLNLWKRRKTRHLRGRPMAEVFTSIYEHNSWRDRQSRSGAASTLKNTAAVRAKLPPLLAGIGARSLLDIPCGDFQWMRETPLELDRYIGADIVAELVAANSRYEDAVRRFVRLDLTSDPLPEADVVLCRDCLIHFSYADIAQALANIRASGSRWLLTTTFRSASRRNVDIVTGDWRPLNLEQPPFNLPPPTAVIEEGFAGAPARYSDRSLALWPVSALPPAAP
jgi:SAM-dependent methyltransferase